MFEDITLVIPTHNRQKYLSRILDYYSDAPFKIIVADSSNDSYSGTLAANVSYHKFNVKTLTEKLALSLQLVKTPYVFMCADDDFIILEGVKRCLSFLKENPSYYSVQGNIICYLKETIIGNKVDYRTLYNHSLDYRVNDENPFDRLASFFKTYRTNFYGVHQTINLVQAFDGVDKKFTSIYLNEYLTNIIPLIKGNFAELPFLFQVREYSTTSDGAVSENVDAIFTNQKFKTDFDSLIEHQAAIVASILNTDFKYCKENIEKTLTDFAHQLKIYKQTPPNVAGNKKIGNLVSKIPFLGNSVIKMFRDLEIKKRLEPYIRSSEDLNELKKISRFIQKHA